MCVRCGSEIHFTARAERLTSTPPRTQSRARGLYVFIPPPPPRATSRTTTIFIEPSAFLSPGLPKRPRRARRLANQPTRCQQGQHQVQDALGRGRRALLVPRHAGGGEQERGAQRADDPSGLDPPHGVFGLQVVARDPGPGLQSLVVRQLDAPLLTYGEGGGKGCVCVCRNFVSTVPDKIKQVFTYVKFSTMTPARRPDARGMALALPS